jgi:hypothetical protein
MTASRDPDRLIHAFFEEGPDELPDPVYDVVRDRIEQTRQRADVGLWRTALTSKTMRYGLAAAAVAVIAIIGFGSLTVGPTPGNSPSAEPSATASVTAPSSAFDDVLNAFLAARVAGAGAQEYLGNEQVVPLLYATTSGAPYERAEFEPVVGIEWPYGLTAFKVRLFAADTVVEQLFFAGPDGPLLSYERDGFGTHIAPTTENGQPVAMPYDYFDGEVTLHAANPWIMFGYAPFGRLIPEGPGVLPTTDGAQRHDGWDTLFLMADPVLIGKFCQAGPDPADAAALAQSIRSDPDPDLEATAPVGVSVAGAKALMMDVKITAGAMLCRLDRIESPDGGLTPEVPHDGVLRPVWDTEAGSGPPNSNGRVTGQATGDWMRLYLFDVPDGLSMRILVIAIVAPEARFERAVGAAAPVVDSVEFHAP